MSFDGERRWAKVGAVISSCLPIAAKNAGYDGFQWLIFSADEMTSTMFPNESHELGHNSSEWNSHTDILLRPSPPG